MTQAVSTGTTSSASTPPTRCCAQVAGCALHRQRLRRNLLPGPSGRAPAPTEARTRSSTQPGPVHKPTVQRKPELRPGRVRNRPARIEAADLGGICNRTTGADCVNPPPGSNFYPFYSTGTTNGTPSGHCVWQLGGAGIKGTTNTFGGNSAAEFGPLLFLNYATLGNPNVVRNVTTTSAKSSTPTPAQPRTRRNSRRAALQGRPFSPKATRSESSSDGVPHPSGGEFDLEEVAPLDGAG